MTVLFIPLIKRYFYPSSSFRKKKYITKTLEKFQA